MTQAILTLLTAMVGYGGFAAILQTIRWYKDRRANPVPQGLMDISKIYEILQSTKSICGASRVTLLKLHNGGGRPQAGNVMYSSALYEVYSGNNPIAQFWQQERIDNDSTIRNLLIEMFDTDRARIETSLEDGGKLMDKNRANKVTRSIFKSVGGKENEYYYLDVSFEDEESFDKARESIENESLRICANQIKEILNCD